MSRHPAQATSQPPRTQKDGPERWMLRAVLSGFIAATARRFMDYLWSLL